MYARSTLSSLSRPVLSNNNIGSVRPVVRRTHVPLESRDLHVGTAFTHLLAIIVVSSVGVMPRLLTSSQYLPCCTTRSSTYYVVVSLPVDLRVTCSSSYGSEVYLAAAAAAQRASRAGADRQSGGAGFRSLPAPAKTFHFALLPSQHYRRLCRYM